MYSHIGFASILWWNFCHNLRFVTVVGCSLTLPTTHFEDVADHVQSTCNKER